jgi:hypothetical protein
MSNMSYCRFENTLSDLKDCIEPLYQGCLVNENEYGEYLSQYEFDSAIKLIELCREITEMYQHADFDEVRQLRNKLEQ